MRAVLHLAISGWIGALSDRVDRRARLEGRERSEWLWGAVGRVLARTCRWLSQVESDSQDRRVRPRRPFQGANIHQPGAFTCTPKPSAISVFVRLNDCTSQRIGFPVLGVIAAA